jgi:hypothetical protein
MKPSSRHCTRPYITQVMQDGRRSLLPGRLILGRRERLTSLITPVRARGRVGSLHGETIFRRTRKAHEPTPRGLKIPDSGSRDVPADRLPFLARTRNPHAPLGGNDLVERRRMSVVSVTVSDCRSFESTAPRCRSHFTEPNAASIRTWYHAITLGDRRIGPLLIRGSQVRLLPGAPTTTTTSRSGPPPVALSCAEIL